MSSGGEPMGEGDWRDEEFSPERGPDRAETARHVAARLEKLMARRQGHFRVGDVHTGEWVDKSKITPYTKFVGQAAAVIARSWREELPDMVVGPAGDGGVLAYAVAHALAAVTDMDEVLSLSVKKGASDRFEIGQEVRALVQGKRVLVVTYVLMTGKSMRGVIEAVREAGGNVLGVAAICNRRDVTKEELVVPTLEALLELSLPSWPASECPLCREQVPLDLEVG